VEWKPQNGLNFTKKYSIWNGWNPCGMWGHSEDLDNIWKTIDISKEGLKKIKATNEGLEAPDKDFGFEGVNLRTDDADFSDEEVDNSD
jgi:hypothetical protein